MGLFYKISTKELLEIRNRIVLDVGIPELKKNGFKKSPFSTSWFGRNNLHDFTYELCRLTDSSTLEDIKIDISRGDKWVKVRLNIFKLRPDIRSLDDLNGIDGLQYHLPPNSITELRLRSDDIKGPPLFRFSYFVGHKLKKFYTKQGLSRSVKLLDKNIKADLTNVQYFIKRWHELHQPITTTWTGHQIAETTVALK